MQFSTATQDHSVYVSFAPGDEPRFTETFERGDTIDATRIQINYSDDGGEPFAEVMVRGYRVKANGERDKRSAGDVSLSWYWMSVEDKAQIIEALRDRFPHFRSFLDTHGTGCLA